MRDQLKYHGVSDTKGDRRFVSDHLPLKHHQPELGAVFVDVTCTKLEFHRELY